MRRKPYTDRGLERLRCIHCSAPATQQWSLRPCAIGAVGWYPLCNACDLSLNALVLHFLRLPDADARLQEYGDRLAA